ncbi:MAG: KOW domain-containing RNA-binding protein [Clostridiales bacterium]|jgi:ribosomal protein L14E/L6E/L27E|nr:KOW domain-containing RNA-binding protein [Clostridiales bacterium]
MEQYTIEPGRAVTSKAGRDKGTIYVVCAVDGNFALAANGSGRPLAKPKRKRIKHLKPLPELSETLSEKFRDGKKVYDAELKAFVKRTEAALKAEAEKKETEKAAPASKK